MSNHYGIHTPFRLLQRLVQDHDPAPGVRLGYTDGAPRQREVLNDAQRNADQSVYMLGAVKALPSETVFHDPDHRRGFNDIEKPGKARSRADASPFA